MSNIFAVAGGKNSLPSIGNYPEDVQASRIRNDFRHVIGGIVLLAPSSAEESVDSPEFSRRIEITKESVPAHEQLTGESSGHAIGLVRNTVFVGGLSGPYNAARLSVHSVVYRATARNNRKRHIVPGQFTGQFIGKLTPHDAGDGGNYDSASFNWLRMPTPDSGPMLSGNSGGQRIRTPLYSSNDLYLWDHLDPKAVAMANKIAATLNEIGGFISQSHIRLAQQPAMLGGELERPTPVGGDTGLLTPKLPHRLLDRVFALI